MKLKLSELDSDFKDSPFQILVKDLPDRGSTFTGSLVEGKLSVISVKDGFNFSGEINAKPNYECVRCLKHMIENLSFNFDFLLSIKKSLITKQEIDVVYLPRGSDTIYLNEIFADMIELKRPMNPICNKKCKGLCPICGIDQNKAICSCKQKNDSTIWDELKKLNLEKF